MKKIRNLTLSIVLASTLFSGCATTELQTNVRMSQSVFIDPVKKELRTVFISSKNTSGQPINLEQSLSNELQAKGYKLAAFSIIFCGKSFLLFCTITWQDGLSFR